MREREKNIKPNYPANIIKVNIMDKETDTEKDIDKKRKRKEIS